MVNRLKNLAVLTTLVTNLWVLGEFHYD